MGDETTRRRYWARSMLGWRRFSRARPKDAHRALARLEDATDAPHGDAHLECADFSSFAAPFCRRCGGVLKPDVVFFGENVPRDRVDAAARQLEQADAILIVGSSLMVYSGFRFVQMAASAAVAASLGRTLPTGCSR
jgi:NAD-dependent SIR2 family protein deacetylase